MMNRYSVRNLSDDALEMLDDLRAEERRQVGAILEDCILAYWNEVFEDDGDIELCDSIATA